MEKNKICLTIVLVPLISLMSFYLGTIRGQSDAYDTIRGLSSVSYSVSNLYDEDLGENISLINTFSGEISPENFQGSRTCYNSKMSSIDSNSREFIEYTLTVDNSLINIFEYNYDTVFFYQVRHLKDSLWISLSGDTVCIHDLRWKSLFDDIATYEMDRISVDRLVVKDDDLRNLDSLLCNLPMPYYLKHPITSNSLIEGIKNGILTQKVVPSCKLLEVQFISSSGLNITAINNSYVAPNGFIWTLSSNGYYLRYYGFALCDLIRICIPEESILHKELEKSNVLINLNAIGKEGDVLIKGQYIE